MLKHFFALIVVASTLVVAGCNSGDSSSQPAPQAGTSEMDMTEDDPSRSETGPFEESEVPKE